MQMGKQRDLVRERLVSKQQIANQVFVGLKGLLLKLSNIDKISSNEFNDLNICFDLNREGEANKNLDTLCKLVNVLNVKIQIST